MTGGRRWAFPKRSPREYPVIWNIPAFDSSAGMLLHVAVGDPSRRPVSASTNFPGRDAESCEPNDSSAFHGRRYTHSSTAPEKTIGGEGYLYVEGHALTSDPSIRQGWHEGRCRLCHGHGKAYNWPESIVVATGWHHVEMRYEIVGNMRISHWNQTCLPDVCLIVSGGELFPEFNRCP